MAVAQIDEPQYLAMWRDRAFWWYDDTFYWSTAGAYASSDIKALSTVASGRASVSWSTPTQC
jgi:hypothetical protein